MANAWLKQTDNFRSGQDKRFLVLCTYRLYTPDYFMARLKRRTPLQGNYGNADQEKIAEFTVGNIANDSNEEIPSQLVLCFFSCDVSFLKGHYRIVNNNMTLNLLVKQNKKNFLLLLLYI